MFDVWHYLTQTPRTGSGGPHMTLHTDPASPSPSRLNAPDPPPGPLYRAYLAGVTAHFPDQASSLRAKSQLALLDLQPPTYTAQWFEKKISSDPWEPDREPGLAVGETALMLQLVDGAQGDAMVALCEAAGATRVTFYPARRIVGSSSEGASR